MHILGTAYAVEVVDSVVWDNSTMEWLSITAESRVLISADAMPDANRRVEILRRAVFRIALETIKLRSPLGVANLQDALNEVDATVSELAR